jgi:hypothetical protein
MEPPIGFSSGISYCGPISAIMASAWNGDYIEPARRRSGVESKGTTIPLTSPLQVPA